MSCSPKQIDLQAFLLLQLPYCVSVLLLTSECKSAVAQYKRRYYLASPHNTVYMVYLAVILIWRFGKFLSVCQI